MVGKQFNNLNKRHLPTFEQLMVIECTASKLIMVNILLTLSSSAELVVNVSESSSLPVCLFHIN